mgnify:CR=1 FL=1
MDPETKDLVPIEAASQPDLYERKYMEGDGAVLLRDKSRAPWPLHAIFLVAMTTMTVATILSGAMFAAVFALPTLAIVWLLFLVLRVTVSERAVNIQYGLFGPKIPIAAIETAEPVTYDWKKFGGWGIRRSRDGAWIYNMPGDGGHAVRILWRDASGRRRDTLIGSRHAPQLAAQIGRARLALPAAPTSAALPAGDDDEH